jgi:hypothetical protein
MYGLGTSLEFLVLFVEGYLQCSSSLAICTIGSYPNGPMFRAVLLLARTNQMAHNNLSVLYPIALEGLELALSVPDT